MLQPDAPLRVNLKVGIEVIVAERPLDASGCAIRELVGGDVRVIVGESYANRDWAAVIGRTDIPGMGSIAQKPRMIRTTKIRSQGGAGGRVAIVRGNTESTEHSG